ncbi:MAG: hypothetical protein QM783_15290 [Phycisphaerales bacterium]
MGHTDRGSGGNSARGGRLRRAIIRGRSFACHHWVCPQVSQVRKT